MKNKNLRKIITIALAFLILAVSIYTTVQAVTNNLLDTSRKASLTINKYEYANSSSSYKAYSGVEFSIYYIASIEEVYNETESTIKTVTEAEEYIKNNSIQETQKGTTENGTIKFEDLTLGRYLVVETDAPKNVLTKIESFLIDLPYTKEDGTELEYDVTVEPKNYTYYGDVTLTKTNQEGETMQNVVFTLEKEVNGIWVNYKNIDTTYNDSYFTTNEEGKIEINDLEYGNYRIYETETQTGYILDSSDIKTFSINEEKQSYTLEVINYKPEIEKYIELTEEDVEKENKSYGETKGVFSTQDVAWKIVADIPKIIGKMATFSITDNLSSGLEINESTVVVYIQNELGEEQILSSSNYEQIINGQTLTINFTNKNSLENYKYINIYYNTNFAENVTNGEFVNNATLNYTSSISIEGEETAINSDSDTASVYTGSVLIKKTNQAGVALEGAEFKIAITKENAVNGTFVKDENGNDITVASNSNGDIVFSGLSYGGDNISYLDGTTSYWIVETKAPTYLDENNELKSYVLLSSPEEVQVNSNSGTESDSTKKVVNRKQYDLPLTGGSIILLAIATLLIIIAIIIKLKKNTKKKAS